MYYSCYGYHLYTFSSILVGGRLATYSAIRLVNFRFAYANTMRAELNDNLLRVRVHAFAPHKRTPGNIRYTVYLPTNSNAIHDMRPMEMCVSELLLILSFFFFVLLFSVTAFTAVVVVVVVVVVVAASIQSMTQTATRSKWNVGISFLLIFLSRVHHSKHTHTLALILSLTLTQSCTVHKTYAIDVYRIETNTSQLELCLLCVFIILWSSLQSSSKRTMPNHSHFGISVFIRIRRSRCRRCRRFCRPFFVPLQRKLNLIETFS